jgi:hypothetical protein
MGADARSIQGFPVEYLSRMWLEFRVDGRFPSGLPTPAMKSLWSDRVVTICTLGGLLEGMQVVKYEFDGELYIILK